MARDTRTLDEQLIGAAKHGGHFELVKNLLKQGANVNARDAEGGTALTRALAVGYPHADPNLIQLLLDNGRGYQCKKQQRGDTPNMGCLDAAIANGEIASGPRGKSKCTGQTWLDGLDVGCRER